MKLSQVVELSGDTDEIQNEEIVGHNFIKHTGWDTFVI